MFEKLAMQYYEDEEVSETLQNKIKECLHRARAFLPGEAVGVLNANQFFHDWYLTEFSIHCDHGAKNCKLTLSKGSMTYHVLFSGVTSLSTVGELVSDEAIYPGSDLNSSLAQVLAFWLDYQNSFEICMLLDSERFVTIQADGFTICK